MFKINQTVRFERTNNMKAIGTIHRIENGQYLVQYQDEFGQTRFKFIFHEEILEVFFLLKISLPN
jgi:hypothetical protein